MLPLQNENMSVVHPLAPISSKAAWDSVIVLLVGAVLAPDQRTATTVSRVPSVHNVVHFSDVLRGPQSCLVVEPCP